MRSQRGPNEIASGEDAPLDTYRLLKIEKAGDKTQEVEDAINQMALEGWEVVGYSACGWRGITVPTYTHLILLRRQGEPELIDLPRSLDAEAETTEEAAAARGEAIMRYTRGLAYMKDKLWIGAAEAFSRAIEAAPDFADAYASRAEAHRHRGDLAAAAADLEKAISLSQQPEATAEWRSRLESMRREQP